VAELYIGASQPRKTNNTMIVPSNLSDVASVVASHDGARQDRPARSPPESWVMSGVALMFAGSVAAQQPPEVRRVVTKLDSSARRW